MAVASLLQMKLKTYSLKLMASHPLKRKSRVSPSHLITSLVFMEEFDTNRDGRVSWEEFREAMVRLKAKVNNKAAGAKEY